MKVTIRDVAAAAGLSRATVDRVLNNRPGVKARSRHLVLEAAARLGYLYEEGGLVLPARPAQLEFFLPVAGNRFLASLATHIEDYCAKLPLVSSVRVHQLPDTGAQGLLDALDHLDPATAGLGILAVDDPRNRAAVERLAATGLRVVTMLSDLPGTPRADYVGIDNHMAGRLAAHLMSAIIGQHSRAEVAIILGSRQYRGHIEREQGFRDVMGARAPGIRLLTTVETGDDSLRARQATETILQRHTGLAGLYVAGGGRSGVIQALEGRTGGPRPQVFCHDLSPQTRRALEHDLIDIVIDQNARLTAEQAILRLLGSLAAAAPFLTRRLIEPRIVTRENLGAKDG